MEPKIKTMKIFPKGQVVIPVELRNQYHIEIGDQIDIEATDAGILLKPKKKSKKTRTLTEKLFGVFSQYSADIEEKNIDQATENGFIEGFINE